MKHKKGQIFLALGILCLIASFVWMVATQSSVGPFLILASAGGALLANAMGYKGKK